MAASAPPACSPVFSAIDSSRCAGSPRRATFTTVQFASRRGNIEGTRAALDAPKKNNIVKRGPRKITIRGVRNENGGGSRRAHFGEGGRGISGGGTSGSESGGGPSGREEDSGRGGGRGDDDGGDGGNSRSGGTGGRSGSGGRGSSGWGEEAGGEGGGDAYRVTTGALLPLLDHFQARVSRAWQIRAPPAASALLQSAARLPPLLRTSATSGALLAGGDVCAQCIELASAGDAAQIRVMRADAAMPSDTRRVEADTLGRSSSGCDSSSDSRSGSSSCSTAISRDGSGNAAAGPAPWFNAARSVRMMVYGACIYGPALHVWYPLVERAAPGRSLGATVGKVLASQALLNPCLIAAVFAFNYAWTGQLHALKDKYRQDFLRTWRRGWHFWLPASFASFRLVPLHLRPTFSSACSLLWNCHLSMVTMHQVDRHGKRDGAAIIAVDANK
ncbi:unnamed protein product [Closterium sp. NIES-53]